MQGELFPVERVERPPEEKLSAGRRRTLRQAAFIEKGVHPLTSSLGFTLQLAPDAPRDRPRRGQVDGMRCGNCRWRQILEYRRRKYPKCLVRDGARVTHGAASDVRAWWPACGDFEYGDPAVSEDAARWVPQDVEVQVEESAKPVFYSLPAEQLEEGMSTADGQDVLSVTVDEGVVLYSVYTPRSDDPEQDEKNRLEPDSRLAHVGERVGLGVFPDTDVDGSELPSALPYDGTDSTVQ